MFPRYCQIFLPEYLDMQFQMVLLLLRQVNISEMHHYSQFSFFQTTSFWLQKILSSYFVGQNILIVNIVLSNLVLESIVAQVFETYCTV